MFSVVPNIVLAPNMMQNAERKHRTQNTNTAHIRLQNIESFYCREDVCRSYGTCTCYTFLHYQQSLIDINVITHLPVQVS